MSLPYLWISQKKTKMDMGMKIDIGGKRSASLCLSPYPIINPKFSYKIFFSLI